MAAPAEFSEAANIDLVGASELNPGNFDMLHREVRDVFTTNHFIEGAKIELNKPMSPIFQVTHRFLLGGINDYNFASFYAHNRGFMHGEIDTSGNLAARFHYSLLQNLTMKFQSSLTKRGNTGLVDFEMSGPDYTANLKTINPDVVQGTGILCFDYLQTVTRGLALGVEAMAQKAPTGAMDSALTFVGRKIGKDYIATANLGLNGSIQATYYQKVNEQISIGTELEVLANSSQRESVFTVGGKFDFKQATFRCQIDSHGKVAAVLEEKLAPGLSFVMSGEIDHAATQSRFGMGLIVG